MVVLNSGTVVRRLDLRNSLLKSHNSIPVGYAKPERTDLIGKHLLEPAVSSETVGRRRDSRAGFVAGLVNAVD